MSSVLEWFSEITRSNAPSRVLIRCADGEVISDEEMWEIAAVSEGPVPHVVYCRPAPGGILLCSVPEPDKEKAVRILTAEEFAEEIDLLIATGAELRDPDESGPGQNEVSG